MLKNSMPLRKFSQHFLNFPLWTIGLSRLLPKRSEWGRALERSGPSSLGEEGEKLKSFLARRSDGRPVRSLCPVQEALTGGLDESSGEEQSTLEHGSEPELRDEWVDARLSLSIFLVHLLDEVLDLDRVAHDPALAVARRLFFLHIPLIFI